MSLDEITKNISKGESDWGWVSDVNPHPIKLDDIPHFYNNKFIVMRADGDQHKNHRVDNHVYWLEPTEKKCRYNVCWFTFGKKKCVTYLDHEVLERFILGEWLFIGGKNS